MKSLYIFAALFNIHFLATDCHINKVEKFYIVSNCEYFEQRMAANEKRTEPFSHKKILQLKKERLKNGITSK